MREQVNPMTGLTEMVFLGKLVSVAKKPQEFKNEAKTEYYPATVSFTNNKGVEVQRACIIYGSNYEYGMQEGTEYQCKAINSDKGVLIIMSHLTGSVRATVDDFEAFSETTVEESVTAPESIGEKLPIMDLEEHMEDGNDFV